MNKIKILTITLMSILLAAAVFGGIYVKDLNSTKNIVKEYSFVGDLEGYREIAYAVADTEESKSAEDFEKVKEILEDRITRIGEYNYKIALNENTGRINISLLENQDTDNYLSLLTQTGTFEIIDTETEEVLLSKEDIESVDAIYGYTSEDYTTQMVNIQFYFNEEASVKLQEISNTYVEVITEVEDEEGEITEESETKTVTLMLSGMELLTTSFDEELLNGMVEVNVGSTSNIEELNGFLVQAINIKTLVETDSIPVELELVQNRYMLSQYDGEKLINVIAVVGLILSGLVYLVKLNARGVLATITTVFTISLLLLIVKYANVELVLMSISGLAVTILINAILTYAVFDVKDVKDMNAIFIKAISVILPIIIVSIAFTFTSVIGLSSFGMMLFWGMLTTLLVNYFITKNVANIK